MSSRIYSYSSKDMISGTFNGVSLFARYSSDKMAMFQKRVAIFAIDGSLAGNDHTIDVYTSADGSAGAKVSIHKALAWSALTIDSSDLTKQLGYSAWEDGDAYDSTCRFRCTGSSQY